MKVHNADYSDYKTARQWAKQGFLPIKSAIGVELWANCYCQNSYVYYSVDEVAPASAEQLSEFFKPERERKNAKAKMRRQQKKEQIKTECEQNKKREKFRKMFPSVEGKTIIIDAETTGLNTKIDELLQVSVIDVDGNVLFNSYFRPKSKRWDKAQDVNHISPDMVKDAPSISERLIELNSVMWQAEQIVGYNTYFDLAFLENSGIVLPDNVEIIDVMQEFAGVYGEYSEYYGNDKYQKLTTAADYYGYDWTSRPEGAHNSLADCYATLFVYEQIYKKGRLE